MALSFDRSVFKLKFLALSTSSIQFINRGLRGRAAWVKLLPESDPDTNNLDVGVKQKEVEKTDDHVDEPKEKPLTAENQYFRLSNVMVPLWFLPYSQQLKKKQAEARIQMTHMKRNFKKNYIKVNENFLDCLETVIPSPIVKHYRHKDEFGVLQGIDGNDKTVGFFIGSFGDINSPPVCVNAKLVNTVKKLHKNIADEFQEYIRNSPLAACHQSEGHWRGINLHSTRDSQVMATVNFHPQNMSTESVHEEEEKLKLHFQKRTDLSSLYFQACSQQRCTPEQSRYVHLYGEKCLRETSNGVHFNIYPYSFVQINMDASEKVDEMIRKLCFFHDGSVLVNVNCGSGVMCLYLSKFCKFVHGIDKSDFLVSDAKENTALNQISNISFHGGQIERRLVEVVDSLDTDDCVVILNGNPSGLSKATLQIIRECSKIKRVIYISSGRTYHNQEDFIKLCQPSSNKSRKLGKPFSLAYAVPFDLLPSTKYVEIVYLFDR